MNIQVMVIWVVTPCNAMLRYQGFGRPC